MMNVERAAVSARPEDILIKLRNAPPSWLRGVAAARGVSASPVDRPAWHHKPEGLATAPSVTAKPSRPQTRSLAPVIGWVAGVCCPGVSRPAHCTEDRETLPEQFTGRCMEALAEQSRTGGLISLTWGHDGPEIASSRDLDLLFRVDRTVGLGFEARLRDTPLGRQVLAEIDGRSLGVSIGFHRSKSWIVERDGVGRVRVVDSCFLHHVALLERSETLRPIYTGARAYGVKDSGLGCPMHLRQSAEAWAFRQIAAQAGVR